MSAFSYARSTAYQRSEGPLPAVRVGAWLKIAPYTNVAGGLTPAICGPQPRPLL